MKESKMSSESGKRKRDSTTENCYKDKQRKQRCPPSADSGGDLASASALPDAGAAVSGTSWSTVTAEIQRLTNLMPKIRNFKLETSEACTHEVAIPENVEYKELVVSKDPPAREYKFQLDPFQREAILCIENNQSVLVSAHTSAGKTVVAEYAIALSLKKKQRVIYTTPIKALSNQKYYEMLAEFDDVGLMTGDITINQDATCLIMTTEILRSMLYKGSEVMKEMAWVVFDEIHYMRDKERGVVWEETIILLPDAVKCVFLSATIPNARQFAEWICCLYKQPCHVVYTDYRPTPLQHYVFPAGGEGLHLVVDEHGAFREDNFNSAMSILKEGDAAKGDQRGRRGGLKGDSNVFKIVKLVMEQNMAPVIVFSFSKKDCEDYAKQMSKLYFTTTEEEKLVDVVFQNAIDYTLSDDEKDLPQVKGILPLLKKGIGIHHSGLLPVLKEIVEILFSEGLIKALFATETFAMGLNMPARTVLFTHARKFDGNDFRWISSGEYIQMSGRAGRRGLDDKGIVILMVDEKMSPGIGKDIIKGQPNPLLSAFRVTYSMVLNLLRIQDINPEYMLEKSFYTFQNYANILQLVQKMEALEKEYKTATVENEEVIVSYYSIQKQLDRLSIKLASFVHRPHYIIPFLKPGRLLRVIRGSSDFGWCVVTGPPQAVKKSKLVENKSSVSVLEALTETANLWFREQPTSQSTETPDAQRENEKEKSETSARNQEPVYDIQVLVHVSKDTRNEKVFPAVKPCPPGEKGQLILMKVEMDCIVEISAIRLDKIPQDLKSPGSRAEVLKTLQFVHQKFPSGFDLLDPIKDMHIKEEEAKKLVGTMEECRNRLKEHPLNCGEQRQRISKQYEAKMKIQTDIASLKMELKLHPFFLQIDELTRRKRVLRRLGYAKLGDVIQLKGHAACEISSGDELLLTELLFNGVFNNLTPEETCSLLSCLVFQEKSSGDIDLSVGMQQILHQMQDVARSVAKATIGAKLPMDEEHYIDSFRPDMMEVVNSWCKGSSFSQICDITEIYEGSIIRCMRRLQEALFQMYKASKAIGNAELEIKFCKGIYMIKRNIVNACSLYLPKNF